MKYLTIIDILNNTITVYTGNWPDDFDFYSFIESEGFDHKYCNYMVTDALDITFKQYKR